LSAALALLIHNMLPRHTLLLLLLLLLVIALQLLLCLSGTRFSV
jgi:hypothetical protein